MSEWVEFDDIKMDIPGCVGAVDLTPLLARRGGTRGTDVLIESFDGVTPAGRRLSAWYMLLEFRVFGKVNFSGTAYPDLRRGVRDNIAYIEDNIVAPYSSGTTIPLVHRFSDGAEWGAPVIVEDLNVSAINRGIGTAADIALSVKVPSGRLTEIT